MCVCTRICVCVCVHIQVSLSRCLKPNESSKFCRWECA
uniref:Uncharacterized protein n=1 Tax=Anguilla anguilla TaxID=7936 RepID=A0A0E9URE4_ANGAN